MLDDIFESCESLTAEELRCVEKFVMGLAETREAEEQSVSAILAIVEKSGLGRTAILSKIFGIPASVLDKLIAEADEVGDSSGYPMYPKHSYEEDGSMYYTDASDERFNPDLHSIQKSGVPTVTSNGMFRKKTVRKSANS